MSVRESDRELLYALPMRDVRRGLSRVDDVSDKLEGDDLEREDLLSELAERDPDSELHEEIVTGAKEVVLDQNHVKTSSFDGFGDNPAAIVSGLDLREVHYYDSFFKFTNITTRVYRLGTPSGFLSELADTDSTTEARERFEEYVVSAGLDEMYATAATDQPSPLIGATEDTYRPRVVAFEDASTIYVEYWKRGNKTTRFDVDTGDYETIHGLRRGAIRIDVATGLVEAVGDANNGPKDGFVERVLGDLSDGTGFSRITIPDATIERAKERLALKITLDELVGENTKVRFTRNRGEDVETDPDHEEMERERDQARTNFLTLFGRTRDEWEVVPPSAVAEMYDRDEDVELGEIKSDLEFEYDDVLDLTLTLDSEKSIFRILKRDISPSTRNAVFTIVAEELGWI
jgi:hypothetical protein